MPSSDDTLVFTSRHSAVMAYYYYKIILLLDPETTIIIRFIKTVIRKLIIHSFLRLKQRTLGCFWKG